MRILFLCAEYDLGRGGVGANVASMVPGLAARGHDVHVLSCFPGQPRRDFRDRDVWVHRRGQVHVPLLERLLRPRRQLPLRANAALSAWLEYLRLGVDPDVVHVPDWMAEGLVFALLRSKPLVAYLATPLHLIARHNDYEHGISGRMADLMERTAVRRATIVTSTSQLLADDLAGEGWLGEHRPVVIPPPVDLDRWAAVPPAEGTRPVVLHVGRVERRKAPDVLLQAAAKLAADVEGLEVVFVGRSEGLMEGRPYADWVAAQAKELGVPCRMAGDVTRDELPEWYGTARVVAVSSHYESFSMVALEAMAAGRPVVCTASTGVSELLGPSGAGEVVPPGDPGAMADALRRYLEDATLAGQAGRRGRQLVEQQCAPDVIAARREQVYADAITQWRRRSLA